MGHRLVDEAISMSLIPQAQLVKLIALDPGTIQLDR
jgi:hypothetical protein